MATLIQENVAKLSARAAREVDEGRLPSCQLALALDGEVVHEEVHGDATPDSRYVIFSATKPIVASTVWTLIQEGALDPAQRVAEVFPEFGETGKDQVTVEQVMLHTAGFPHAPMGPADWATREARIRRMSTWRLGWEPGTRYEYHATSAHWVLAELITRLTGLDHREAIRARVLDPLGLDRLQVGVPADQQADVLDLEERGEPVTPEEVRAVLGIDALPVTEVTDEALLGFNAPGVREVGVPGGGGISDARSLALFYQALLHDPKGIWDPALLADVTSNVRNHLPDPLMGTPAERTLGLVTAGSDGKANLRGFGHANSPQAFGHNGAAGQIAWADPATGLSFVYLTNGIDKHLFHQARRGVALSSIAATCAEA
jgi:CubicO group peptidase (beta-lactamase class C family)